MDKLKVVGWIKFDSICQNIEINSREINDEVFNAVLEELNTNHYYFDGLIHQDGVHCSVPLLNNGKCVRCSIKAWDYIVSNCNNKEVNLPKEIAVDESSFKIDTEAANPITTIDDSTLMKETIFDGLDLKTNDKVLQQLFPLLKAKIDNQFD